ncbi:hypothetical protein M422DRAFT_249256 [Sphaerobolus stellatus SS14]|uniref:MULE transposase domain-containing protein n=1 Tax=Sphaerobolus stellatus (strain SS14) TaxID=990650 RepID=A0A0C9W447_SPHS4|nr:hypothetical protein M422DRAFT_249256 [Sphaerobolus stellatus SS14]
MIHAPTLKLQLEKVLVHETYDSKPHELELSVMVQPVNGRFTGVSAGECDHAGQPRDRRKPDVCPTKRRNPNPSIKVGCMAKIYACQPFGSDKVKVIYDWEHTGHNPVSLDDMPASRNPDDVRTWLDNKVSEGFDQKAIKAMLRMSTEELLEITPDVDAVPYSIKISAMDIYNAKWLEKLCEAGWNTLYEPTPGEEIRDGFTLALCSPWQKQLIAEYGDTVCLDSTHNTCRGNNDEKIFLSTILARDRVTGRGVPLAFMLTNRESHYPLDSVQSMGTIVDRSDGISLTEPRCRTVGGFPSIAR